MLITIEFDIEFPGCLPFMASQTAPATDGTTEKQPICATTTATSPGEEEVTQVPLAAAPRVPLTGESLIETPKALVMTLNDWKSP